MYLHLDQLLIIGFATLAVAWVPLLRGGLPLTLPMLALASGGAFFAANQSGAYVFRHIGLAEQLTEFVLIIGIMGAGLKIDRRFHWSGWSVPWRLLGIAMPLSILGITLAGYGIMGLPLSAALLLGSALAPTDPVLASAVQAGPPGSGEEDDVRFSLTAEAGLNDGSAFPFVNLALLLAVSRPDKGRLIDWVTIDLVWKLSAALTVGFLLGWILVRLNGWLPKRMRLPQSDNGLVALGITFLSYGLTQLVHGYGFVAVFVTAVTLRNNERSSAYAARLHAFADEVERLALFLVLFLLGGAISGGLLAPLSWPGIAVGLLALFVVRPIGGVLAFLGARQPWDVRAVIGYLGIRGLASLYYIAYALDRAHFAAAAELRAVVAFVVTISVVVYGVSVNPIMQRLDRRLNSPRRHSRAASRKS